MVMVSEVQAGVCVLMAVDSVLYAGVYARALTASSAHGDRAVFVTADPDE
jgi:hypothetical protein